MEGGTFCEPVFGEGVADFARGTEGRNKDSDDAEDDENEKSPPAEEDS